MTGPCSLPPLTLNVATLGGCASAGFEDGPRGGARFDNPSNVAIGPNGLTYVVDAGSGRVRTVDSSGETVTLVRRPDLQHPYGIAVAPGGTIYVQTDADDSGTLSPTSGTIWRVAANGDAQVIVRGVGRPRGLAVLTDGRVAMADPLHHTLSILDPATGTVTPLAGALDQPGYQNDTGDAARFAKPSDLVQLPGGDLAVSDQDNHRIRRVTLAGVVGDLAGTGAAGNLDGPAAVATFDAPHALAIAPSGALYVTDTRRNFIRRIAADTVTTVAGDGGRGWLDSDAPRNAKFSGLEGLDADGARLVVADGNRGDGAAYHHVRVLDLTFL
jgi:DNA-binding beta-propeller fold protein YncE